jgi:hypothetical protein
MSKIPAVRLGLARAGSHGEQVRQLVGWRASGFAWFYYEFHDFVA